VSPLAPVLPLYLKDESLRIVINHLRRADTRGQSDGSIDQSPYNELIHNDPSHVGVRDGLQTSLVLKDVPPIKELADVPPDVMLQEKLAPRMRVLEVGYIEDQVVKDDQVLPSIDSPLEFSERYDLNWLYEVTLPAPVPPVVVLHAQDQAGDQDKVCQAEGTHRLSVEPGVL